MASSYGVPQVLEHVDLARWERAAQLLQLVDALQQGPNPVPLGTQFFVAAGRSARQAKYDVELLGQLAEQHCDAGGLGARCRTRHAYRVLIRWAGSGSRPDAWGVAPLEGWRRVPWITPRRDVLRAFSASEPDVAVGAWTKSPGQPWERGRLNPHSGPEMVGVLSVNQPATLPRHLSTLPRAEREIGGPTGHAPTATSGSSPCFLDSENPPSLPSPTDAGRGRERGGSESRPGEDPAAVLLTAVVANHAGDWIGGAYADRIREVGRSRPGDLDRLVAFAGRLGWVRTAAEAARQIEQYAAVLDQSPEGRRAVVQAEIDSCGRCDHHGLILLDNMTVMRCDHTPDDEQPGVPSQP